LVKPSRRGFESGKIAKVINSFEPAQIGAGVRLKGFEAEPTAEFDHMPIAIEARKAAAALHVLPHTAQAGVF
jgi:hypothetical protein